MAISTDYGFEDEDKKKSDSGPSPIAGASPTVAPSQGSGAFGFGGTTDKDPATGGSTTTAPTTATGAQQPTTPGGTGSSYAGAGVTDDFGFGAAPTATATSAAGNPAPGSTQSYLEGGLNSWLNDPSRYNAKLVQDGADVIQKSLEKLRSRGKQSIGEHSASRGLVGSSLEFDKNKEFEEELQRLGGEQLFNLQREQANTYGQDRAASIGAGLGFGNQSLQMLGMGMQNDLSWAQMEQDSGFRNRALQLQSQGMTADDAYRQAALDWQKEYGNKELGVRERGVNAQTDLAMANLFANAPPELWDNPQFQQWMQSRFQGGSSGTSNRSGLTGSIPTLPTGASGAPQQYTGGTEYAQAPAAYGFNGGTMNAVAPPGGFNGTSTVPAAGGFSGTNFGFQSVPQATRPNYGVTQEAQRRLGMTGGGQPGQPSTPGGPSYPQQPGGGGGFGFPQPGQGAPGGGAQLPPMPNGATSPMPGGGGAAAKAPWTPQQGPPTMRADGFGTTTDPAEFERQQAAYMEHLRGSGQVNQYGTNTQAYDYSKTGQFIPQGPDDPYSAGELEILKKLGYI